LNSSKHEHLRERIEVEFSMTLKVAEILINKILLAFDGIRLHDTYIASLQLTFNDDCKETLSYKTSKQIIGIYIKPKTSFKFSILNSKYNFISAERP